MSKGGIGPVVRCCAGEPESSRVERFLPSCVQISGNWCKWVTGQVLKRGLGGVGRLRGELYRDGEGEKPTLGGGGGYGRNMGVNTALLSLETSKRSGYGVVGPLCPTGMGKGLARLRHLVSVANHQMQHCDVLFFPPR